MRKLVIMIAGIFTIFTAAAMIAAGMNIIFPPSSLEYESLEKLVHAQDERAKACYQNGYWRGRMDEYKTPNVLPKPLAVPKECQ